MQMGGIGFVHYNMSIQDQVAQVALAKRHQAGLIALPEVLAQDNIVADIHALKVMSISASGIQDDVFRETAFVPGSHQIMSHLIC